MIYNPFQAFAQLNPYKASLLEWQIITGFFLVGGPNNFGLLDYLFIIPGVIKQALQWTTPRGITNRVFNHCSEALQFVKTAAAMFWFLPLMSIFTYPIMKVCHFLRGKLTDPILDTEVYLINPIEAPVELTANDGLIQPGKLLSLLHESKKIPLREHPQLDMIKRNVMEGCKMKAITLQDEGDSEEKAQRVIGIYPIARVNDGPLHMTRIADIHPDTKPVALILPSRQNQEGLLRIKKLDAFFYSQSFFRSMQSDQQLLESIPDKNIMEQQHSLREEAISAIQANAHHAAAIDGAKEINGLFELESEILMMAGLGNQADIAKCRVRSKS